MTLSPEILKARLRFVLAYADGADVEAAYHQWCATEQHAMADEAALLVQAIAEAIGEQRALSLVLFGAASFRNELMEVVDGGR